ncbi:hypothetical protein DN069_33205 [Streptacidiphilus pinicola]|uniref:Uncharacterized protein n=1 Tax=Streptacidiphilus pinicola TaxID=2219663 RepID=A0A2X0ICN2_9ACTN|nr:hypothetical protein [Streptacidiphilus pinicola]RAG81353.1 hypothetical protein DN069_33205 [Streptacidiphilus pinicola]
MKQLVRRIGRSLAFVLPLVLVTTGTLAVAKVSWAPPATADVQSLAAASDAQPPAQPAANAPQDVLKGRLLRELAAKSPAVALNDLERTMDREPSLRQFCSSLARELGQAAVRKYHGDVHKAMSYARPVCDASFAAGTLTPAN